MKLMRHSTGWCAGFERIGPHQTRSVAGQKTIPKTHTASVIVVKVTKTPAPAAIEHFAGELEGYQTSKGAVQVPWGAPIPYELIVRLAQWNVKRTNAGPNT